VIGSLTTLRNNPGLLARRARAGLAELAGCGLAREPFATVGFCFGGLAALTLARSGAGLAAAVSIHGSLATARPAPGPVLSRPGCWPATVLWTRTCRWPTSSASPRKWTRPSDWQLIVYGGAMHGFTHQTAVPGAVPGVAYHRLADERSFAATRAFLAETLS
jgi:dienelactone hydrolase